MANSKNKEAFNARRYMELAIAEMHKSVAERRTDGKVSPKVGAVLVSPEGEVLGTAHRGELREGDHAEFTLLERKFRGNNVTGNYLFATLEPCAPGARKHPKLGCAERIVNARIAKVWIGVEDPDPTVDRKGFKYLEDCGIEVDIFDSDLQPIILAANAEFIEQAKQRAEDAKQPPKEIELTPLEKAAANADLSELSDKALNFYLNKAGYNFTAGSDELIKLLVRKQLVEFDPASKTNIPTGLAILLFGNKPRDRYPQAVLKAEARFGNKEPEVQDFADALVLLPEQIENWLKRVLSSHISRERFSRTEVYDFPLPVLREAIINALVHRDYDLEGAKCYVKIDENQIVVQSPGLPVKPIKLEDVQQFKAPSLSRNPKLMAIFNEMKYAEERGLGMEEMKSLPEKHQLPRPSVTWQEPFLTINFPRFAKLYGQPAA